jgi:small subunit ribosomal protein S16
VSVSVQENGVAVRIRLKRVGRRHRPFYRVAAVDGRRPRDSKVIEELGHYDPCNKDPEEQVSLKRDRIDYWLSVGAQATDTVRSLLKRQPDDSPSDS